MSGHGQIVRTRRDGGGRVRWILAGARGAVEYHALTLRGVPNGIEYHSPRPEYTADEPVRCDILEGPCYPTGTSLGAVSVHRAYEAAGWDEAVIWRELERRYQAWGA
jgi:hypothetical protein